MKRIVSVLLVPVLVPVCAGAELSVWFLDVGQGDCTVVVCDGVAMVIDGGPWEAGGFVSSFLADELGVEELEHVVLTHPHTDHAGGLVEVLRNFPVENVWTPVTEWDGNRAFSEFMTYVRLREAWENIPSAGDRFYVGSAAVTVLHCWPVALDAGYDRRIGHVDPENDMGIVVRIDYGSVSVIVTGDAEQASEYQMLDDWVPLGASVLRVAHHGSRWSSTEQFLSAVSPSFAVISCGEGNRYGHPHEETLDRLREMDVRLFRTDLHGTVRMVSDGEDILFVTERAAGTEEVYTAHSLAEKVNY